MNTRPRVRKTGALLSIVAAATPATLYQLSPNRTGVLVKLMCFNGQAGNVILELGDGLAAAFVRRLPRIFLVAGMDLILGELECPAFEFAVDLTAQVDAAGAAPANVELFATVDEIA